MSATQLDLFGAPETTRDCPWILFDLDLGDHIARAVSHKDVIWVYHAHPGPAPYSARLARIDQVPGGLDDAGVRRALRCAERVWPKWRVYRPYATSAMRTHRRAP